MCNILPGPAKAASGDLDTSFGIGGKLVHDVSSSISDLGLALGAMVTQPDGKILMAGSVRSLFVLARYNPNGTIDASFGVDGVSEVSGFRGSDLDLMDDGRIVAAGTVLTPGTSISKSSGLTPTGVSTRLSETAVELLPTFQARETTEAPFQSRRMERLSWRGSAPALPGA